jgi:hypothetical protein
MIEIIGYAASILIAISITIKGGFYFRILNMAGSICFLIYGLFIGSWPVAIINIYGTGINLFHLIREKKKESQNKQPS